MKNLVIILVLLIGQQSFAQVSKINMQASGLTCSMCSNSINKSLKSISYVDRVLANIKNSTFDVSFKPGADIDFDELRKKVEDAGFFVSQFLVTMKFDGQTINNDEHIYANGNLFHFLSVQRQQLTGDKQITVLDKGFVSSKVYKKNSSLTKMSCYKSGLAEACCTKEGVSKGTRIYHVTI